MRIAVQMFAVARQLAGQACVPIELPEGATVADLRDALLKEVPGLQGMSRQLRFAVDEAYAPDDRRLTIDSRVACIPPVSGG